MAFRDTYSKISRDNTFLEEALEGRDAEILSLKAQLKSANTWRNTQTEIIERLTKELNYQLSATEQYRKELDQMRESIIKSRPGQ